MGIGVSAIFLGLLVGRVDGGELRTALTEMHPQWLVLALGVYFVALWVRGLRWQLVLSPHVHVTPFEAFSLLVIGYAANNVLPVRAGEFVRAGLLQSRHGTPWATGLGAIVVERVLDGLVLALFLSGTVLLAGGDRVDGVVRALAGLGAAGFLGVLVMMYALALAGDRGTALLVRLLRLLPVIGERLASVAEGMLGGLAVLRDLRVGPLLLVTTVATWGLEAATYWLVGEGFDLGLAPALYLGVCGAANLAIAAPSTSGGIGPFEYFARLVAVSFGAATAAATAYALVVHAVVLVPVVLLGAFLLWRQQLGFGSLLAARERLEATTPIEG
ncbi:MAG: flippase-like domain-containing protein [Dehalococcoidia bacterium]|nr:flippase-like domain-containing protein [Dehalococcoidia bacterium]